MRLGRDASRSVHVQISYVTEAAGIIDLIPDIIGALASRNHAADGLAANVHCVTVVENTDLMAAE